MQVFQQRVRMPRKDRGTRRASVLSVLELHFVFEDGRRVHIVDMDDLAQGRAFARHVAGLLDLELLTHPDGERAGGEGP